MKKAIYLFVVLISFLQCKKENSGFTINGSVIGIAEGTEIFLYDTELGRNIQKSIVTEGEVAFHGRVEGFRQFYLHLGNFESYRSMWIENSDYTIKIMSNQLETAKVSGSKLQEQGDLWDALFTPLYKQHEKLNAELRSIGIEDSLKLNQLNKVLTDLQKKIREKQLDFLESHPDLDISAFYLFETRNNFQKEQIDKIYNSLSNSVKNNYWGKKLDLYLHQVHELKIGETLSKIELNTINDELVPLNSLQGKFVLVEFWESSCHSCAKENAFLAEAYHSFKQDGFEIYAICLDREKSTWQNTLNRDKVDWITVSDLQGLNGDMAIRYNITYMPANYLLDKNGIIIAKDLRGKALTAKLDSIFGN